MAHFARFLRHSLVSAATLGVIGAAVYGALHVSPSMVEPAEARADIDMDAQTGNTAGEDLPVLMAQAAPKQDAPKAQKGGSSSVTTTTTRHGGWTVSCSEGGNPPAKTCSANYRVVNKNNNSNIMVWLIGRNKDGKLLTEFVSLPNVQIRPGVQFTLDEGKPVKADYVECTTQSCKSRVELTPTLVRQMKAAKKVKVDLTRLDGQVVQFTMDVTGIDLALGDLGA